MNEMMCRMTPPEHVYSVVAARRMQWDNLLWQVPILSLTAQAFLYTIELGSDTSRVSRVIAAVLSLVVTFLCVTLMARHRQADIYDAHWLEAADETVLGQDGAMHGHQFARRRNAEPVDSGWADRIVPLRSAYKTWIGGLLMFGAGSVVVIVLTVGWPQVL